MRGMTNLGLYSGVAINASVEEKTVYGDEIFPGNFVEYKQESLYDDFSLDIIKAIEIENDYVVAKTNAGITLFKAIDRLLPLNSYGGYNVTDFAVYGDDVFLTSNNKIVKLHIENETISFVKEEVFGSDISNSALDIFKDRVIVAYSTSSSASYGSILFVMFDLNLTKLKEGRHTFDGSSAGLKYVKSTENFVSIFASEYHTGARWNSVASFYLSEENDDLVLNRHISGENAQGVFNYLISSNNEDVFFAVTSFYNNQGIIRICYCNVEQGSISVIKEYTNIKEDYLPSNLFDSSMLLLSNRGSTSTTKNLKLLILDVVSKTVQDVDDNEGVLSKLEYQPFGTSKGLIAVMQRNTTKINYFYSSKENPIILQHSTLSIVMNFSGKGNPIGVAKTGGVENEEIEVYVPMV